MSMFRGPDHTDKWIPVVQDALITRYDYAVFCAKSGIDYGAIGSVELFVEDPSAPTV